MRIPYFNEIKMNTEQRHDLDHICEKIAANKKNAAFLFLPEEMYSNRKIISDKISVFLFVEPEDFSAMIDISDEMLKSTVALTVILKKDQVNKSGILNVI